MLNFADNWLFVHPMTLLTSSRSSAFDQMSDSSSWPVFREAGVRGLYVAPIQGGGALWAKDRDGKDTGDDVVQYDFSRAAGKDGSYQRMMGNVIDNNALLGSDIIPAATGLGPDFFLAARNVREYPGIYCMVEIPEDSWGFLPETSSEWSGAALGQAQIEALNAKGLLPKSMRDESSPLGRTGGWAATGVIRGMDGNRYRWVYRYSGSPEYAVLNWEDPSQTAHRILSGSAVRQVGLQGQALLGLKFEAFQGLEAAPEGLALDSAHSVEPALTAAQSMSRELRRYGGWSWLRDDDLPLNNVNDFLGSGADFLFDSVFSPAAEHALLTGDANLARFMADEALRLKIDFRRLVHVMPAQDGINYALPHLAGLAAAPGAENAPLFRSSIQTAMHAVAGKTTPAPVEDNRLYSTGPGLAALALGLTTQAEAQSRREDIERGHSLLIFFKAMQPGVMMLAGQDLAGVLPLQFDGTFTASPDFRPTDSSRGAYGLTMTSGSIAISTQGTPRAPQLYDTPDAQIHQKTSFLSTIGAFLRARTEHGIAKATLAARPATKGQGSIALLSRMPDGKSHLLSVCNFSREKVTETISLAAIPGLGATLSTKAAVIATGGSHSIAGGSVTVSLGPWQGRALLLQGRSGKRAEITASNRTGEKMTPVPEN
jgi:trehalose synthase